MKKMVVVDTNVLLADGNAIYSFENCDVVIPLVVLEELDRIKGRPDDVGRSARQVTRALDELRSLGNLNDGVKLRATDSTLRIVAVDQKMIKNLPVELQDISKFDHLIIAVALNEMKKHPNAEVTLISKDINVRIKCDAIGILSEDYRKLRALDDASAFYKGYDVVDTDTDTVQSLYAHGWVEFQNSYHPNHYVHLRSPSGDALAKIKDDCHITRIKDIDNAFGLKPRNLEQRFALDLLFDDDIKLVTLAGTAGGGKTLLALAAGMQLTLEGTSKYDRLIISRPVQPVGKDIGFLPGTLQEKMDPWIAPIKDNLDHLCRNKRSRRDEPYLDLLLRNKKIEIEAITYIRGRSIPDTYLIIDEAQNLSLHELKTIITRVGDGTKIVLTGDIEQIDNNHVDMYSNGLTHAIEAFKEHKISGHVTLMRGERSALATLASKIL